MKTDEEKKADSSAKEETPKEVKTEEKQKTKEKKEQQKENKDFQHLVRVSGVVLDGNKDISRALINIRGIKHRTSRSLIQSLGLDQRRKLGTLSEKEIEAIEKGIEKLNETLPKWMLNKRQDKKTGEDLHLTGPDLELANREDINLERRIKSYRGVRHASGLPVRGQRTRTSFRKGSTVGVVRKKIAAKQQPAQKKGGGGGDNKK